MLALLVLPAAAAAAPRAVLVEPSRSLGEVEPGDVQRLEFTLRNAGDAPLVLEALEPTCYCTTAKADAWQIAPGGATAIHVTIDPSDFVGRIRKGVEILTNDARAPKQLVQAEMTVRPSLAVVPPEIDFGAVPEKGSRSRSVDLKAARERPFAVESARAEADFVEVHTEPLALEERAGVRLHVKVRPGAPPGPFATRVFVQTDDAGKPRIEIPVRGIGPGGLAVEPARVLFEAAAPGAEVATVSVRGREGTRVTGVRSSSSALLAALEPQADGSCRVRLKLAPSARPGRLMAKVVVSTSDSAQPEVSVPVMGLVR